jgi:hypothetical protein
MTLYPATTTQFGQKYVLVAKVDTSNALPTNGKMDIKFE